MVATKKSSYEEGFEASMWAFTYTMETKRLDWDVTFFRGGLVNQVAAWHNQWRASHHQADEPSASSPIEGSASPSGKAPPIPSHPLEVHHEQVIEDDPMARVDESDRSGDDVEQIDNLDGVLDRQED